MYICLSVHFKVSMRMNYGIQVEYACSIYVIFFDFSNMIKTDKCFTKNCKLSLVEVFLTNQPVPFKHKKTFTKMFTPF